MNCDLEVVGCTREATTCITWRSPNMAAPSFWYQCDECAAHSVSVLRAGCVVSVAPIIKPAAAPRVPANYPVKPLKQGSKAASNAQDLVTCGTCGRSWDDAVATSMTPAPSARCPFEYFHA